MHCADVHLDMPCSSLKDPERSKQRRRELLEAFFYFVDYAKDHGYKIALVAGDFWHGDFISYETVKKAAARMELSPGTRFFIAPGNHDPAARHSFYALFDWPKNVTVFGKEPLCIPIEGMNVDLYGRGFTERFETAPLLSGIRPEDASKINILLMHGDIQDKNSRFNPMTPPDIEKSGFDYIAGGHVHKKSGLLKFGAVSFLYPGSLSAGGFDEPGAHGFYEIEVEKGYVRENFVAIPGREYREIAVEIQSELSTGDVTSKIRDAVLAFGRDDIYKVVLKGERKGDANFDLAAAEQELANEVFGIRILDETTEKPDYERWKSELSLRGYFVRAMMREDGWEDERERKVNDLALTLGCRALTTGEVDQK